MRFAWIDERPFSFMHGSGLVGCDVTVAQRAIEGIGETFEPVHTTFGELLPGLAEGRWEVTTGMFVTAEREAVAPFTEPIWSLSDGLLVAEEEVRIAGYRDLATLGVRVAVLGGQVQHDHALTHGVRPHSLVQFDTYHDAAAAVSRADVAAYASVALAHQEHLAAEPRGRVKLVRVPADEVAASVGAFACASAELRDALNTQIRNLVDTEDPQEPSGDPAKWVR